MKDNSLIVILYPNGTGLGYLVCENPKEIIRYGMARIRPLTINAHVKRLHDFIDLYQPALIVLRNNSEEGVRMSNRVRKTIEAFEKQAKDKGLSVYKYSRADVKNVFSEFGKTTKYGISKTISTWYPELASRMPNMRRNQDAEHYQMGIFDVFALMLTHHYIE